MQNRHFTLLEALIVCLLLGSLTLPLAALGQSRKAAKAAACQSNLGKWGVTFAQATADNNGYFWPGTILNDAMWFIAAKNYYTPTMLFCPEAMTFANAPGGTPPNTHETLPWGTAFHCWGSGIKNSFMYDNYQSSYGMNVYLNSDCYDFSGLSGSLLDNARIRRNMYQSSNTPLRYWQHIDKCEASVPMLAAR